MEVHRGIQCMAGCTAWYMEVCAEVQKGVWRGAEMHSVCTECVHRDAWRVHRGLERCVAGNDDQSNSKPLLAYTCLSYWL